MILFDWVLWHINHSRLFNAKYSVYVHIKYIWFGLIGFYGISTIVVYLMPNPILYIYIEYIWFALVGFYGISTIVDYLIPNPIYIYIYIYMIWFYLVLWHINQVKLFNDNLIFYTYISNMYNLISVGIYGISTSRIFHAKSCLYICIKYSWFVNG